MNMVKRFNGKVLFMDDEEQMRSVAGEILSYLGFDVETVCDGNEALQRNQSAVQSGKRFDLAILDVVNEYGMGGIEAARQLVKVDPELKMIVSSGTFEPVVTEKFSSLGFDDILPKPYTVDALVDVLDRVL